MLKVILHVAENDSKYRYVAPLRPARVEFLSKMFLFSFYSSIIH